MPLRKALTCAALCVSTESDNEVNGIPSCANKMLMTDYAREKWGFQGYITSDCGAVDDVQNSHHYTSDSNNTCRSVDLDWHAHP